MTALLKMGIIVGVMSLGLPLAANAAGAAASSETADKEAPAKKQADVNAAAKHETDNTGRNKRDRDDKAVTADDQSNDSGDVEALAKIRRAIVGEDGLSTNAQNVKIMVEKNTVTLRGVVDSKEEKARVAKVAKQASDGKRVLNKLEIASKS